MKSHDSWIDMLSSIWLMTQFQRDESHADPSTFFAATGLDCGVSLDLRSGSCSMHTRWTRSSKYPCDSMWFNMMGYDGYNVRCNQSVVTSGFVLLAQRLSFRGAVHICNERSRAAVELIHQLVPIRFQLLAVAWYNMKKIKSEIKQRIPWFMIFLLIFPPVLTRVQGIWWKHSSLLFPPKQRRIQVWRNMKIWRVEYSVSETQWNETHLAGTNSASAPWTTKSGTSQFFS